MTFDSAKKHMDPKNEYICYNCCKTSVTMFKKSIRVRPEYKNTIPALELFCDHCKHIVKTKWPAEHLCPPCAQTLSKKLVTCKCFKEAAVEFLYIEVFNEFPK